MNELKSLTLTQCSTKITVNPVQQRRTKLASKLAEQIAAAQAAATGGTHLVQRVRRIKGENGTSTESVQRRVRQWFVPLDDKRWAVMVRYGSQELQFSKGKNAVEAGSMAAVITVLETLRRAVLAGELDSQLENAAAALKRGFKK